MVSAKDKFLKRKFGVFNHYLGAAHCGLEGNHGAKWCELIENIDIKKLAGNIAKTGAGYYFITVMQRGRYMLMPNKTFDAIAGTNPGEACAKRDIIPELYKELKKYDIDLFLYFTGDGPFKDAELGPAFGLTHHADNVITDSYVQKWASVLEEYSVRYGEMVKGWWIDGCYRRLGFTDEQLELFVKAAKKGNPNALVSMNNGLNETLVKQHPSEDFTAGEFEDFIYIPDKRFFNGAQAHILAPLGVTPIPGKLGLAWCAKGVKYDADYMTEYIRKCNEAGCVVTIDIYADKHFNFDEEQVLLLSKVRENLGRE